MLWADSQPIRSEDWEPLPKLPLTIMGDGDRLPFGRHLVAEGRKCYHVDTPAEYRIDKPLNEKPKKKKKKKKAARKPHEYAVFRTRYEPPPKPDLAVEFLHNFGSGERYYVLLSLYKNFWHVNVTQVNAQGILEQLEREKMASYVLTDSIQRWYMNEQFRQFVDHHSTIQGYVWKPSKLP